MEWEDFEQSFPFWSGTGLDAFWHFTIDVDSNALLDRRVAQKSALARYGKQPWVQWDEVDLEELEEAYGGIIDLVKRENAMSRMNEDR